MEPIERVFHEKKQLWPLVSIVIMLIMLTSIELIWADEVDLSVRMPDIRPDHKQQYLCTSLKVPDDPEGYFITYFEPDARSKSVHHMVLSACSNVYDKTPGAVWQCGGSYTKNQVRSYPVAHVCENTLERPIYGWSMKPSKLRLPKGVGIKVGGETNINYIVLQIHYGDHLGHGEHGFGESPDPPDNSGIKMKIVRDDYKSGIEKRANTLVLLTNGHVEVGKSKHEIWCDINEDAVMHPFMFRVHTHALGTHVMGAKLTQSRRQQSTGPIEERADYIIGSADPQSPELFAPVTEPNATIRKGDTIYARCEYNNNGTKPVQIGQTSHDEMCNFYVMYWTRSTRMLPTICVSYNPPEPGQKPYEHHKFYPDE